jgi:hypothetical protein
MRIILKAVGFFELLRAFKIKMHFGNRWQPQVYLDLKSVEEADAFWAIVPEGEVLPTP